MSIDFQGKKFYPRFHGASASALCFRQIFGHWKTLLLFLFRLSARTGFIGATGSLLFHTYPKLWQSTKFLLSPNSKKKFNKLYVCINKMLTRCNQTETFLLIEKTNRHCLPFLFSVCHKKDSTFLFSVFIQPLFHSIYFSFSPVLGDFLCGFA
jgi:hypothetical protein